MVSLFASQDDDWDTDPDYVNHLSEKDQRYVTNFRCGQVVTEPCKSNRAHILPSRPVASSKPPTIC